MAEAWASHILNHLLCFLWWIKNEYLDKTINWKSAKKQFLIQEYLRLLYSFTGLGEFGSLYQDYTLTSLFFCIQNLMLPYPGLSGSAFDYQDQWTGEKKSCGETRQIQNEMRLQSLLQFPLVIILVSSRLLLAKTDLLLELWHSVSDREEIWDRRPQCKKMYLPFHFH